MPLSDKISSSEAKYLNLLRDFFIKVYPLSCLPSHGIEHHSRVWQFAKEILRRLDHHGFEISQSLTDNLIVSCFLHDSGMAADAGPSHGAAGRIICGKFLSENKIQSDAFTEALHVIENHDNKEYFVTKKPDDLITILSVADDLDAFGYIGIYRYLEIYITRGKPMKELGHLITENCESRYRHFLRSYGFDTLLVNNYSGRYNVLCTFFDSYNQQALYYDFGNQSIKGHCGIAEIVEQTLKDPVNISPSGYYYDPVIQHFYSELEKEFSDFRKN